MKWVRIGTLGEIPLRGARIVETSAGSVAVFRTAVDEVFAISNRCAHKGGPLSEGIVCGRTVTCPLHNWIWSLESGEAQGADHGKITTYPARIENDQVWLDLAALDHSATPSKAKTNAA